MDKCWEGLGLFKMESASSLYTPISHAQKKAMVIPFGMNKLGKRESGKSLSESKTPFTDRVQCDLDS